VDSASWVAAGYSIGTASRDDAQVTVLQFHQSAPPAGGGGVQTPTAAAAAPADLKAQLDRIEKKVDDLAEKLKNLTPAAPKP
jgi:hypothetical protein